MQPSRRSCCTTPSAILFWGVMFLVLYSLALWARSAWPAIAPYGDTLLLVALGLACGQLRSQSHAALRSHGSALFLIAAVLAALAEAGLWRASRSLIWGVVLIGVAVAFVVEWRVAARPHGRQNS